MSVSRVEELISHFKSHNKIREQQSHSAKVHSVGWSCDGKLLASGSFDKSVCIFSLGPDRLKQETTFRGHGGSVDQLCWHAFYPELLSTASGDKTVRIWDTRTQKCTANISTRGENINISWSPDGNTIAVGNKEDLVTFIDARVMKIRAEEQFNFEVNEISWNKDSDTFYLTNGQGCVHILSYPDLELLHVIKAHPGTCICIEFDPTGRYFATGSADALVSLWDADELCCLRTFSRLEWPVRTISFSYNGQLLAAASEDLVIDIGEVETGEKIADIPVEAATFTVAWHPKQYLLAYACDDKDTYDRKRDAGSLKAARRALDARSKKIFLVLKMGIEMVKNMAMVLNMLERGLKVFENLSSVPRFCSMLKAAEVVFHAKKGNAETPGMSTLISSLIYIFELKHSMVMETNCECQYTLMVMNEIVQGQLSETKDNFNHVPSIHEVVEEDTDEEYVYDQDSPTVNDVQQDAGLTENIVDDDSIYSNESFCSDESSDEINVTSRTLNESHYTPKAAEHEREKKDNKEKCESPIQARENVNSLCSSSSMSDDRSTILKSVKCRRKNMSFTDEELRKIEWENQLLLRKIMAQQKPKEKILHENMPQTRQSSSAINRKKLQRKIESENIVRLPRRRN